MTRIELAQHSALIVFAVNSLLLAGLIALKSVHRRRVKHHDRRRQSYLALLSRHVAYENCTDPITAGMAEDPAFLDALLEIRNAVAGPELATLLDIVSRHGVLQRQTDRLRSPFPLGRRLRAAVALAEIGDESSAPVLMEHLEDREPEIRIQSARGLGRIQWTPAIDRIVWRFSVETPWVRARFSDTLTRFGAKATWPLLAYIRINHHFETAGPQFALKTLAQVEDRDAVGPLLEILEDANNIEIEIAAIEALGELGSPKIAPALQARLESPHWELRAKAATALGAIGDTQSVPLLLARLHDPDWWVRRNSAAAIAQLPGGINSLYEALEYDDRSAADAAAEALTDAGELVSARRRLAESGSPGENPLLAHMGTREG